MMTRLFVMANSLVARAIKGATNNVRTAFTEKKIIQ